MDRGRPPAYTNAEEMEKLIDEYFDSCGMQYLKDEYGDIIKKDNGEPVVTGEKIPTVTGLALALGFNSRQSLLNYQAKEEFVDTLTRAKSRIEEYVEQRLFDRDGVQGAKFSLKNNFKGWSEAGVDNSGDDGGIQAFLVATRPTKEQLAQLFQEETDGSETTEE